MSEDISAKTANRRDLPKRLRNPGAGSWAELMEEAADEIERLRSELDEAYDAIGRSAPT